MRKQTLYRKIKNILVDLYGDRLRGVILFGSEARGDAGPDSDIDVLVVLNGRIDFLREMRRITHALYDLETDTEPYRPINALPISARNFESRDYPMFREVKKEGVWL